MILDFNPSNGAYILRVPRDHKDLIRGLVREHGLDLSTSASSASEAVLFTKEPFCAASFAEYATDRAKQSMQGILDEIAASWAPTSGSHYWSPPDGQLWDFQRADLDYALRRKNTLVGDQPGLGKTPIAICYANEIQARHVLVVCPANIRRQWERRIREWSRQSWEHGRRCIVHAISSGRRGVAPVADYPATWNIVSYDLARTGAIGSALARQAYDLIILDECFGPSVKVSTNYGQMAIGELVNSRLPVKVWSRNDVGRLELMTVTRYIRTPAPSTMLRIHHEKGILECTTHHKIYVDGFTAPIPAKDIRPGQVLRVVYPSVLCRLRSKEVLRETMLRHVAEPELSQRRGASNAGGPEDIEAWPATRRSRADAEIKFRSGISRQSGRRIEVAERTDVAGQAGRQRLYDETAGNAGPSNELANRIWDTDGSSEGQVREFAELLQSGPCVSREIPSGGSGREQPQHEAMAFFGSKENSGLERSRVDRVEVYQQAGSNGPWVYNIEVEGNHNYFADGVLVGNCHYLKTVDSKRTRAIFGGGEERKFDAIGPRAEHILALTGTPLPNRPREAYTISRGLCYDAIDWLSEDNFTDRFNPSIKVDGTRADGSPYTYIDERSGRHGELQNRLRANFMVRHLKREVMSQLQMPEFDLIQVEETGPVKQALAAEKLLDFDPDDLKGADASILGHVSVVRHQMGLAIAPQVVEYVDMLIRGGEDKIVLFGHHIDVLDHVEAGLAKHGVVRIDGRDSAVGKERKVRQFVEDASISVCLGNSQAIGIGTDGLQEVSNHGLIFEPDWVPGNNQQCFDRLDRGGQRNKVFGEIFVAPGSIAEKILASALRKAHTTHAALDKRMGI